MPETDMLRFDTLDKKPNVWSLAVLAAVTAAVLAFFLTRKPVPLVGVGWTVGIALALTIVILLRAFFRQLRYNPYSYNTIYYTAFALFFLAVLVFHIVLMFQARSWGLEDVVALPTLFGVLLGSAANYIMLTFPFILVFAILLIVSNLSLIRHEGRRLVNLLGILLAAILIGGEVFLFLFNRYVMGSIWEVMAHDLVSNLIASFYLYFECMLIGSIIANAIAVRYEPERNKEYLIILGCGIRKDGTPTPLLRGRIDRALAFAEKQLRETGKELTFVASGGKGPNECVPESEAIRNYLLEKGVPAERILTEDRSSSTYENMRFSKKVIEADGKGGKIAFATTNYHVFRSGLMARRVKMRAVGMGAKTKWYFWPNAAVREFVGILTEHRLKQGLILGGMAAAYLVMTLVNYLAFR